MKPLSSQQSFHSKQGSLMQTTVMLKTRDTSCQMALPWRRPPQGTLVRALPTFEVTHQVANNQSRWRTSCNALSAFCHKC